jgi:DNA-binding PadR family transcriptional regulator
MVPKGFIRYHVLEALNEKPMSGSELMEELEKRTGGFWKPSPGSIYPLLNWLQEKAYITELPLENGSKRYELTKNGKSLLDEQKKIMSQVREEMGFPQMPLFGRFFEKVPPEKTGEIRQTMGRLARAFFKLGTELTADFSEEAIDEAIKAVNDASTKLEEISNKLRVKKHE